MLSDGQLGLLIAVIAWESIVWCCKTNSSAANANAGTQAPRRNQPGPEIGSCRGGPRIAAPLRTHAFCMSKGNQVQQQAAAVSCRLRWLCNDCTSAAQDEIEKVLR